MPPDYDDIDIADMDDAFEAAMVQVQTEIDQYGVRMLADFWRKIREIADRHNLDFEDARDHAVGFLLLMSNSAAQEAGLK